MSHRLIFLIIWMLVLDLYAYQAVRSATSRKSLWRYLYSAVSALSYAGLTLVTIRFSPESGMDSLLLYFIGWLILFYVPKLLICGFMVVEDFTRLIRGIVRLFHPENEKKYPIPGRRAFVGKLALGVAALPFLSISYGIWRGRYNYKVIRKELWFDDLPAAFDGFTITQLSDFHTGSFDNPDKVRAGMDLVRSLESDLIVFTGDMVNNRAVELDGWENIIGGITAPFGMLSILGNHDYGHYIDWKNEREREENFSLLLEKEEKMGFRLLRNSHHRIEKGNDSIVIAGVENWGKAPFPQYGDISKSLEGTSEDDFVIMLSHDPSHFDEQIAHYPKRISLTLSGHTHGMQFGIEIPGIRWSPSQYRYPKWAGHYRENGRHLYVNRGFGYLAFPGRVGIWPEITRITLRRSQ